MEPGTIHTHARAVAARLTIGILSLHIIGMFFLVLLPATASAATLAELTAAIDAEYNMVEGVRTTLKLQESDFESGWIQYQSALSIAEALEKAGVELDETIADAIESIADAKAGLVPVPVPVDKTALIEAIDAAQGKHEAAVEGAVPGMHVVGSKATLQAAIDAAAAVNANEDALQGAVDQALADLTAAVSAFDAAIVPKIETAASLSSTLNPSVFGQSVTFSALVSPEAATGSVTFTDGATVLGTASVSQGSASITIDTLAVGAHTIIATYGGNDVYEGSASSPLTQTVQAQQGSGGTGGGGSGGRRGAGTLSAAPFRSSTLVIAPPAFGGLTSSLSDLKRSQRITFCRVQDRIASMMESVLERHADRLAKRWGWTAERVLAGFRDDSLCQ